jgi:hypothetical protein
VASRQKSDDLVVDECRGEIGEAVDEEGNVHGRVPLPRKGLLRGTIARGEEIPDDGHDPFGTPTIP